VNSKKMDKLVKRVIKRHGAVLDLKKNPDTLIDIAREIAPQLEDENPCGGTPPSPAPPPGKGGVRKVQLEDVMKQVLQLSRDLAAIKKDIAGISKRQK
jgi:hypothetical protein